jgi:hypothetical protein
MCPKCHRKLVPNPDFRHIWWLFDIEHLLLHCPNGHGTWFKDSLLTKVSVMLAYRGHGVNSD